MFWFIFHVLSRICGFVRWYTLGLLHWRGGNHMILTHCVLVKQCESNGLLPDGANPSPESILTSHQWNSLAFTWEKLPRNGLRYQSWKKVEYYMFEVVATSPRDQWVNAYYWFCRLSGSCGWYFCYFQRELNFQRELKMMSLEIITFINPSKLLSIIGDHTFWIIISNIYILWISANEMWLQLVSGTSEMIYFHM